MTKVPLAVSFQLASVSGNRNAKRSEIERFFELDEAVDIWLLTETWLRCQGDDAKCVDVTPPGYTLRSFPPPPPVLRGEGGGILTAQQHHGQCSHHIGVLFQAHVL